MKCASCDVNIDPKWKYAIEQNICPFCGQNIMDEYLKNLLISLSDTINKLSDYEEQLNDFMLSNFQFIKTTSKHLADYLTPEQLSEQELKFKSNVKKVKNHSDLKEVNEEKQENNITSEIFKRADLLKDDSGKRKFNSIAEKMAYIKSIAEKEKKKKGGDETASMADINISKLLQEDFSEFAENPENLYDDEEDDLTVEDNMDKIPSAVLRASAKAKNSDSLNRDLETLKRLKNHAESLSSTFTKKD